MYKIGSLHKLITSLSLVVAFLVAFAATCPGPYYVYAWRESGGPTMGPWFQLIGQVSSPMGGNAVLSVGGIMVLDNRTWWPSYPTPIYNANELPGSDCGVRGTPCRELFYQPGLIDG